MLFRHFAPRSTARVSPALLTAAALLVAAPLAVGQVARPPYAPIDAPAGATLGQPDRLPAPAPAGQSGASQSGNSEAANGQSDPNQRPDNAPPPPSLPELMRRNHGSLYAATAQLPKDDPQQLTASEVSFYNVPVPKPRTLSKHDLITVIVREQSSFKSDGKTDLKKDASLDAELTQFPKIDLANFAFENAIGSVAPRIAAKGNREFKTQGTVDRNDSFTARIQAEIVDVKPNGTFVLQARKRITTDEEEQLFILTGVARVQDVLPDNTLLSTQLYDLELKKTHKGAVRDATKRGWIPRALDWLNPF